jgi:hypothetical protein
MRYFQRMLSDEDDMLAVLNAEPPPEGWLRTDEHADVVASFDLLGIVSPLLLRHPPMWKWLIVGAHSALQGAIVCALSGSAGIGALEAKLQAAMLERMQSDTGVWPRERLAPFPVLLKWARDARRMAEFAGKPLTLTAAERKDLAKLNKLRNKFVQFTPTGWSIESTGLPRIVLTALEKAEHLMLNHPSARLRLTDRQVQEIEVNAGIARAVLGRVEQ